MQYHIQTLVKHLFDKDSFEQVTVQELKQFTDDYPYAAVGQFLYAQKLKDSGSYNHYDQSGQASLYFHNALWLRWQLDNKEEAPALPVKAEEAAQQPGFRIVVQMPKTTPADISDQPAVEPEEIQPAENKEQEPVIQASETTEAAIPDVAEQDIQPAAEQTTLPVSEEPIAEEPGVEESGKSLTVNEAGSLVEHTGEQTVETPPAEEAVNTTETASTVAIAESSQLAEEIPTEAAAENVVSITEEVLIPAVDMAPEVEATPETVEPDKEVDDIIPAVELAPAEAMEAIDDIIPAVEVTPEEVISAAEEVAPAEAIAEVPPVSATAPTEATAETTDVSATAPPEIIAEEQAVEEVTETIAAEEPAAITAEAEQPVSEEAGTTETSETTPSALEQETTPEPLLSKQFSFTPASREGKNTVDLGEPIFESYHTIDYFASQGIKLMQEELKDKLGKQLKSFTDWLRSMKRIGPIDSTTSIDEVTNQSIQRIAEHSVEEKEVLTEAMAEVWAKQGNPAKAIRVYEKLSLLNPAKSPYFAGRIEQLKAQ
jgi:hypothetical protein